MHIDNKTVTRFNVVALSITLINNISVQVCIFNVCTCFRLLSQSSAHSETTSCHSISEDRQGSDLWVMPYNELLLHLFVCSFVCVKVTGALCIFFTT